MSPLVLLLVVLAGSISASTIRDYTDGNNVDDIFDHQDNAGTGSEEITSSPTDNIDSVMVNDTNIHIEYSNMPCNEYFDCTFQNHPPEPVGSLREGYNISPGFLKETCRYMQMSLSCYYRGNYAECPMVSESAKSLTSMYEYACVEPGRSAVLSFLPCVNNPDVQMPLIMSVTGLSYAIGAIMRLSDQDSFNIASIICRVMEKFYSDTGGFVEHRCSAADRRVYEKIVVISSQSPLRHFNCTIGENNNTRL